VRAVCERDRERQIIENSPLWGLQVPATGLPHRRRKTCDMADAPTEPLAVDEHILPCHMLSEDGVVLRKKFGLNSEKIGTLASGGRVIVHDVIPHDSGVLRARVIVEGGALHGKEGFVTHTKKDGTKNLYSAKGLVAFTKALPKEALEAARAAFAVFDVDGNGSLSAEELKEILRRPTGNKNGGSTALSDEEVASIIATFDVDGDGELQFEEFAVMFAGAPVFGDAEVSPEVPSSPTKGGRSSKGSGVGFKNDPAQSRASNGNGTGATDSFTEDRQGSWFGKSKAKAASTLTALVGQSFATKAAKTRATFSFKKKRSFLSGEASSSGSVLGMANSTPRTSAAGGEKGKQKEKKKKKAGGGGTPRASEAQMITSIGLAAIRNEALKNIEAAEARAGEGHTLPAVLGGVLHEQNASLQSVVREWYVSCLDTHMCRRQTCCILVLCHSASLPRASRLTRDSGVAVRTGTS
jgi:hypothetical protein